MQTTTRLGAVAISAALVGFTAGEALATDGYFQHGYGARHKALGGAGVADSRDATAASLNPAGLVHVEDQANIAISVFHPERGLEGSGQPGFTPLGEVDSEWENFGIPNIAISYRLQNNAWIDTIALTMYGNGGMNTHYPGVERPDVLPGTPCAMNGGFGVFCTGQMGVNLEQAFISVAAAKRFGSVSIGIAPIIATQVIELDGLQAFRLPSSDPANVSDRGTDRTWGYGIRGGIEWQAMPGVRLGLAGNSRIYMDEFDKYKGLFAEQGDFDIPPSLQAGIAVDVRPDLTFMLDYKRIWYSEIKSINNASTNILDCLSPTFEPIGPGCLGNDGGAGFGWDDIDVIKVGAEWRPSGDLSLRAGYSYTENPISSRDVMFNIIAPGVVQHHVTAGAMIGLTENWDLEIAGMYAFENDVDGQELPGFGNPNHDIEISMYQYEITAGLTYKFGGPAPMEPLK